MRDGFLKNFSFSGNNMLYIINSLHQPIYCLNKKIYNFTLKSTFNSTGEMSFIIDYSEANKEVYNYIIKDRTFFRLDGYKEFVCTDVVENYEGYRYKTVTCKDIEWLMNYRCLTLVDNATDFCSVKLWDTDTTKDSLTTYICYSGQKYGGVPSWSIDFNKCDSEISNVPHKFTGIKKQNLLKFFYENIEETFDCIPFFDNLTRKIWFKKTKNAIEDTGIILNTKNFINQIEKQCTNDSFWTKMYVEGGNLDIRRVSSNGMNFVYYYDSCYDRMSDTLRTHIQQWLAKCDEMQPSYITKHAEWSEIKTEYDIQYGIYNDLRPIDWQFWDENNLKTTPYEDNSWFNDWSQRYNEWKTSSGYQAAYEYIYSHESEVENKQAELDAIVSQCNSSTYLTDDDLIELDMFEKEGSYKQEAFSYIDNMNETQKSDISLLLKNYAQLEINRCNEPRYTWNISLSNFCNIKGCENFADQLNVGKYIRIIDNNKIVKLIVVGIEYDNENPDDLKLTFSDKITGHQKYPLLNEYINNAIKLMDMQNATNEKIDNINNNIGDLNVSINNVGDRIDNIINTLQTTGLGGSGEETKFVFDGTVWRNLYRFTDGFVINGNINADTNELDGSAGLWFKRLSNGNLQYLNENRIISIVSNNSQMPTYTPHTNNEESGD